MLSYVPKREKKIMMSHSVNNNTWVLFVCLFKFKSFDQFNLPEPPQILDIYSVVVL